MSRRLPASMRTRQSLSDVIEGRLSSPAGRGAGQTRLIIEDDVGGGGRDAGRRFWFVPSAADGERPAVSLTISLHKRYLSC